MAEEQKPVYPPGLIPPGDPIFGIPPDEFAPEVTFTKTTLAEGRDWSHKVLGIPDLHAKGIMGEGITIAILDTGVDFEHEDLKSQVVTAGNKDFTGSPFGFKDHQSHGTHCAAIAAAAMNDRGLVGIAPKAKILIVKVLNDQGSGASSWIAAGIRWAADNGAHIISLSLGGPVPDGQTQNAISYAQSKGCWIVAAAGNEGRRTNSFPGNYEESMCIAGTDQEGNRASFSTINPENDIAAPGVKITAATPNNTYSIYSGTSMATPAVAGCLALVRGELLRYQLPIPSQAEIRQIAKQTAKDINPVGIDDYTGAGLIHVQGMLNHLLPSHPPKPTLGIVELTLEDLTATGQSKMRAAGLESFSVRL